MHSIFKITPLLLGVVSLSACSALNLGGTNHAAHTASTSGTYTQVASNTHADTTSDYGNSGWYATPNTQQNNSYQDNPYMGGSVQMDMTPTEVYPTGAAADTNVKMAHNGYHDAYGNPAPAPTQGYGAPKLRGSYGPSYYGNIGGIMYDTDADLYGIIGRLGLQKNWYGAELEGSFGIADEDETVLVATPNGGAPIPVEVSAGIDHSLAAFAVGRMAVGNRINALGRVGYHTTKIGASGSNGGVSMGASESFDGVAYGVGVEYDLDAVNGLRFDYTRYELEEGSTSDALAATFLRRF